MGDMLTVDAQPVRIQRKRTKGWKKPPNAVCVTRGTFWGNPFVVRDDLEPGTPFGQYFAVPTVEDAVNGTCTDAMAAMRKACSLVELIVLTISDDALLMRQSPRQAQS